MQKQNVFFFLILAITSFFAYFPTFFHQFTHFDDYVQIVENPYLHNFSINSIAEIFTNTFVGMYQPVTTLISGITIALFGLEGSSIHILSWLIHLINGILVFKILIRFLTNTTALYILVALFVLHPLQVESVAWASALSTLVFSFFVMLSFIHYLNFSTSNKKRDYLLTLLFFIIGCFAKSAAIFLPLLLVAYDWFKDKTFRVNYLNKIPFVIIAIIFGIITLLSRQSSGHLSDLSETYGFLDRIFLICHSILFYPLKFLTPFELSAFYPYPKLIEGNLPWLFYLSLPILTGLLFLVFKFRKHSLVWFGMLWYFVSIGLVLQFIPIGNQLTTDRYVYLPMIGFLLILGHFLSKIKSKPVLFSFLIIPVFFGILSHKRTAIWENDKTLWNSVLNIYPNVAQAYNNLGSYALKQNKPKVAFSQFNRAIQLQGNYADAYSNRGNIYSQKGQTRKAIKDFSRAIELQPHADAYFNRANEYSKLKKLELAISDYSNSIALNPNEDTYTNRAFTYLNQNKIKLAKADLKTAVLLNPKFDRAYFLSGMIELNTGDKESACNYFEKSANLGNQAAKKARVENCH